MIAGLDAGVDFGMIPIRGQWPAAKAAGIVHGDLEAHRQSVLDAMSAAQYGSRKGDQSERRAWAYHRALPAVLAALGRQDAAFLRALDEVRKEAANDVTRAVEVPAAWAKYKAKIATIRDKFANVRADGAARAWLKSGILRPTFASGERRVFRNRDLAGVFPYMEFNDYGDERVRPAHHALDGFIAASNWDGWVTEVGPPLDWGCRCRLEPVPWQLAVRFGWTTTYPRGVAKLTAFRARGGADPTFPRSLFALGNL